MKQDTQALTAQDVLLQHIGEAARLGDVEALKGHLLVYQAIIDSAGKNT